MWKGVMNREIAEAGIMIEGISSPFWSWEVNDSERDFSYDKGQRA